MSEPTFKIAEDGKSITCLICGSTSPNTNDIENEYCPTCHQYHEFMTLPKQVGDVFVKEFFLVCFNPDGMRGMYVCGGSLGSHPVIGTDEQPKLTPMIGTELARAEAQFAEVKSQIEKGGYPAGDGTLMLIRLTEGRIVQLLKTKDGEGQKEIQA